MRCMQNLSRFVNQFLFLAGVTVSVEVAPLRQHVMVNGMRISWLFHRFAAFFPGKLPETFYAATAHTLIG